MYPSAERVQAARNAAVKAGVWKTALGVVVGVVVSAAQGFVLVAVHAPAFLAVLAVALFFVWGVYLVYRGQRQIRVARGELYEAKVIQAIGQSTGNHDSQAWTFVLQLELLANDGSGASWIAESTNVFGKDKAKQLEGGTIRALWNAAYPTDAYAVAGP